MASLADKAQAVVAERLKNGDFHYDGKTGEVVRVPVKAQIANKILQDSAEAELKIIKQVERTQEVQTQERMLDKLIQIKEAFREAAEKSRPPVITLTETQPGTFEQSNAIPKEQ